VILKISKDKDEKALSRARQIEEISMINTNYLNNMSEIAKASILKKKLEKKIIEAKQKNHQKQLIRNLFYENAKNAAAMRSLSGGDKTEKIGATRKGSSIPLIRQHSEFIKKDDFPQ
jgi:hypothetical protein